MNRLRISPVNENHKFISIKLKFCGAVQTVTGSSHLVTTDRGTKVLLDGGFYQGNDLDFMKSQAPKFIRVLNLLGIEVVNSNLDNQLSDFDFSLATQPGVYYLHLVYEGTIVTRKIIKE
ncbi:MAG: hypothetical protein ACI96L_000196 [Paracoccaceae bacterium]